MGARRNRSVERRLAIGIVVAGVLFAGASQSRADDGVAPRPSNAPSDPAGVGSKKAPPLAPLASASPGEAPLGLSAGEILGAPHAYFHVESVNLYYSHYDQEGHGFQSRAGPKSGPGNEQLTVEQPQAEVIAKQGEHVTHRIWIPVDIVTAASPDAIDLVATASRRNESGAFDWTTTYQDGHAAGSIRNGFHSEENYQSWNSGLAAEYSMAEDNTVISGSVNEVIDWFDKYALSGRHLGHTSRNALNANVGLTQLLSPTTIAHVDYGLTVQSGQLSNGWNIVPISNGTIALETLPDTRYRNAFVGRIAQYLPFEAAIRGSYRFYVDDWGLRAHTLELDLQKRLAAFSRIRISYRFHDQTSVSFFTTRGAPGATGNRTSDSDLASLTAHMLGVGGMFDVPVTFAKNLHFDFGVERYIRSNDLRVTVYSCGAGILFQ